MPFIVKTTRRLSCSCWGTVGEDESGMCQACHAGGQAVSRVAVATLEEARDMVLAAVRAQAASGFQGRALYDATMLTESGGTITLPGGMTVQVEPETWSDMASDLGIELRWDPPREWGDFEPHAQKFELLAVLEAFNAKFAAGSPSTSEEV